MSPERKGPWSLDPAIRFLNHGSFGACPIPVLEAQSQLRARIEREPVRFFVRELEALLDTAREGLAVFVGAPPTDLVFVPNATTGVNAVVRSLQFEPGDELVVTDHAYNACRCALDHVAQRSGARVVVAPVPFPIDAPETFVDAVTQAVTPRTRLALLDQVSSPTGVVFPIERAVRALEERGVDVLVDGAHAPGMLDVDLETLGAAYYTANCHKWICAPKGAGFLYVRPDKQAAIHPTVISHGANSPRTDRSRFWLEFDWTGTDDPTAYLVVPEAIRCVGSLVPGGWPEVRRRNRELALEARGLICDALGVRPACPDEMVGSLAAVTLPDGNPTPPTTPFYQDALQDALFEQYAIEVPIVPWPSPPRRLVRVSAQLYNERAEYESLAAALVELLKSDS